uniref:DUF1336 domain-containing protein n=1 Tax=Macrostomum lignano TaxID=282301 RepID=A0A1I8FJP7_9PLAT
AAAAAAAPLRKLPPARPYWPLPLHWRPDSFVNFGDIDDLANCITVTAHLGFGTHKSAKDFRAPPRRADLNLRAHLCRYLHLFDPRSGPGQRIDMLIGCIAEVSLEEEADGGYLKPAPLATLAPPNAPLQIVAADFDVAPAVAAALVYRPHRDRVQHPPAQQPPEKKHRSKQLQ